MLHINLVKMRKRFPVANHDHFTDSAFCERPRSELSLPVQHVCCLLPLRDSLQDGLSTIFLIYLNVRAGGSDGGAGRADLFQRFLAESILVTGPRVDHADHLHDCGRSRVTRKVRCGGRKGKEEGEKG